ncbi:MAG: sialidase family protein [Anaerolineales bacterium]
MKTFLKIVGQILAVVLLVILLLFGYWYLRPNRAQVDQDVVLETWDIANDGQHNSNTDMIEWQGQFYLAYVSSPYHFGNDASVMHIKRSDDLGQTWEELSTFNPENDDIRDPKFAVIGNRLFLYALKNDSFVAEPYITVYSYTEDGEAWAKFETIPGLDGWLFWRPKTQDGETFYNAAYWWEHGKSVLLKSNDGIDWEIVSTINEGERNDETEIEFLSDGRMLATARLEYAYYADGAFGDKRGATLITVSEPPYENWTELTQSLVARLDGPYLFSYHDRVYAVGRYQPDLGKSGPLTDQGSIFSRKRTALYEVHLDGLEYLTDLPSGGDTSYEGVILTGDTAYISYYTSPTKKDYPWIVGMLSPSQVRMAKVDLKAMEELANRTEAK